ncbi:MAG: hypothetical protein KBC64_06885 [Simkaniaceae bacterium]|nr:hypothetical protein [Simkaniaceae bacterium]
MVTTVSSRDSSFDKKGVDVWLTTTKLNQIALYTLSGIALLGGTLLLGEALLLWTFTAAIPLSMIALGVGALTFLVARDLIDYEDKEQLDIHRQEMKNLLLVLEEEEKELIDSLRTGEEIPTEFKAEVKDILQVCIRKHGLKNMFRYGIPHPKDFRRIWCFMTKYMDLKEVMQIYSAANTAYERVRKRFPSDSYLFDIPSPREFKEKWNYSNFCDEIYSHFEIGELRKLDLISSEECRFLRDLKREYRLAKTTYEKATRGETRVLNELIQKFQKERDSALSTLEKRLRNHSAKQALRVLREKKITAMRLLNRNIRLDPEMESARQRYRSMKRTLEERGETDSMQMEKDHFQDVKAKVIGRFSLFKTQIENQFNEGQREYTGILQMAATDYRKEVAEIQGRYEEKTKDIQRRFEEVCYLPLREFKEEKQSLNRRWSEYRASGIT